MWDLVYQLTEHLRKSPIFYPGEEFTEEVYKDYLLDKDTRFFIYEIKDEIIGIIDASKNGNSFITDHDNYYNVSDCASDHYGVSAELDFENIVSTL